MMQTEESVDAERILLINPPIYDTRLPWARFHQPTYLLRLATWHRSEGADVKLIDMLYCPNGARHKRERLGEIDLDGINVDKWRFGLPKSVLVSHLGQLASGGWHPDRVYVECFATFWWEGVAEVITCVREQFPNARVVLTGAYGSLACDHAQKHVAPDEMMVGASDELCNVSPDLSLYADPPSFAYLWVGNGARTASDIVEEIVILQKAKEVNNFAFADHGIGADQPDLYQSILDQIIAKKLRISLHALGNIAPVDLVARPELPRLMHKAGYKQICFADDRHVPIDPPSQEAWLDAVQHAASLCVEAGFPERKGVLQASLCLGRSGDDLEERGRTATWLAHYVGSVVIWPYQPLHHECSSQPLEAQNGRLFPLRAKNAATYSDYMSLLGLATVLNARYRSQTFDFLGDGLIAQLLRESITRRGWEPDPGVKGTLHLPVRKQ